MKTKDIFQYALAALIVLVFFTLIYVVFRWALPTENKEIGYMVIGALTMKFGDVVAYFFNSTKGSADKTEIISKSTPIGFYADGSKTVITETKTKTESETNK